MSAQLDKVVKLYRSLSVIPSIVGARLTNNQTLVHSIWTQRNLERGENTKFNKTIGITSTLNKVFEALPYDVSNESLSITSPSEDLRAVLRTVSDKQYIEIWRKQNLVKVVDLNAIEVHGDVYTDTEFRSWELSPDETKVLYIAELKIPKSEPFYKRSAKKTKTNNDSDKSSALPKGEEYLYRQDWGEQLVGKKKSVVAQYDIEKDEVEVLTGIPNNVCPAQVSYAPDGSYIVGVAYNTEPRKLGLIYCTNRPSTIFKLDFSGNYTALTLENKSVKSPVFTADGNYLIWLQRNAGGPHAACMTLVKAALPLSEKPSINVVIDIVKNQSLINNDVPFYGLYNTGFPKRCFASSNRLLLSTNQRNTINSYVIDLDSCKITELPYNDGSQIVLDVHDDIVLVNRRNFLKQDVLAVGRLPSKNSEATITWIELTTNQIISGLENSIYEYLDLTQSDDDNVKTFNAIYVGPKSGDEKSVPLIVYPHGGPHSAYANNFSLELSFLLSLGYAVLFINYRGSIGAGQDSVEFLLGKIGSSDVADCYYATQSSLIKYSFLNPDKMVLSGGSHGGFLVTYISGKYPDMFKAVVSRNPVIDVASMSVISDIPDWCYVEAGHPYTQVGPIDDNILLAMRKASPIEHAHKVKAPTLLQIGSKDLRVPYYQGLEFYTRLKANGTTVKMNLYEDNHPLGQVPNEMDNIINAALWFQEHLSL